MTGVPPGCGSQLLRHQQTAPDENLANLCFGLRRAIYNHHKYDNIVILWNVDISEDDKKYPGGKRNEEVLKIGDEQLYIISTIRKI